MKPNSVINLKAAHDHEIHLGSMSRGVSLCLLAASSPCMGNPEGGSVVAGAATIQYGQTTLITQTSNRAVVNWKEFSINTNETTRFNTPTNKSVTLNRVTGNNVSHILGNLYSNGQVFLVNPNGIVFGKTAHVDVAGLVASTANITNDDFMQGHYHFQDAPQGSRIINEGAITVRNAGLAALVAPTVENRGIITATLGKVILGGGHAFTIDLYGDNLITFDASSIIEDKTTVNNVGHIEANGGTVMLTVAAAENMLESVVNTSGYISAQSVSQANGKIVLQGYDNATINVSGTLDVSGKETGYVGGVIQASANKIQLLNGSFIDASGDAGGGHVHIGSDVFHNPSDNLNINTLGLARSLRSAQFVYAASNSHIVADSLTTGKGGNVVVWGDKVTQFFGNISAQAKGLFGDGGRVETSAGILDVSGICVNTLSRFGKSGIWLLDPYNVTISTVDSQSFRSPYIPTNNNSTINVATINTALLTNSVIITTGLGGIQDGDITFNNTSTPISILSSANTSFTAYAYRNIVFNAGARITNAGSGSINLYADTNLTGTGTITFPGSNASPLVQSTGAGAINFYYTSPTQVAISNFQTSGFVSISGGSTFRPNMQILVAGGVIDNTLAPKINAALITNNTGVVAFYPGTITFTNDSAHQITWATTANLAIKADSNLTGTGTISFTPSARITSTGGGSISLYYSPTVFETFIPNFVSSLFISVSGEGTFTPYMQVNMNNASTPNTITNTDATAFNSALSATTSVIAYSKNASLSFANSAAISWATNASFTAQTLAGASTNYDLNIGSGGTAPYITASGNALLNLFSVRDINISTTNAITNSSSGATTWMSNNNINFNPSSSSALYTNSGTGITTLIAPNNVNLNTFEFQSISQLNNNVVIIANALNASSTTGININPNAANITQSALRRGTFANITTTAGNIDFTSAIYWSNPVPGSGRAKLTASTVNGNINVMTPGATISADNMANWTTSFVILDFTAGGGGAINIGISSGIDIQNGASGNSRINLNAPGGSVNFLGVGFTAVNSNPQTRIAAQNFTVSTTTLNVQTNAQAIVNAALSANANTTLTTTSAGLTISDSIDWSTAANLTLNSFTNISIPNPGHLASRAAGNITLNAGTNITLSPTSASFGITSSGSGQVTLNANNNITLSNIDYGSLKLTGSNPTPLVIQNANNMFISNSSNTTNISINNTNTLITNAALLAGANVTVTSLNNINFLNTNPIVMPLGTANFTATTNNLSTNPLGGYVNLDSSNIIQNFGTGTITLRGNGIGNVTVSALGAIVNNSTGAINLIANKPTGGSVYLSNADFNTISNAGGGAITATAANLYVSNNTSAISINATNANTITNSLSTGTNVDITSTGNALFTAGAISWNNNATFSVNATAGGNISFDPGSAISMGALSGALSLTAANDLTLNAPATLANAGSSAMNLTAANAVNLNSVAFGNITNAGGGAITISANDLYATDTTNSITITTSDTSASIINNALAIGSNVTVSSVKGIAVSAPIAWNTLANFTAIADSGQAGNANASTVSFTGGNTITSNGIGNINVYYDSPTEEATDFTGNVILNGFGTFNAFMKIFKLASSNIDNTTAGSINTALAAGSSLTTPSLGTHVIIYGAGDLTFTNTTAISWATPRSLTINALGDIIFSNTYTESNNVITVPSAGILTLNPGANDVVNTVGSLVYNTAGGRVNILDNSSFASPKNYLYNALTNTTGLVNGNATAYQLVYNNVTDRTLNNIRLSGSYVLAEDITLNLPTTSIGTAITPFTGVFSGYDFYNMLGNSNANKSISGLTITSSEQYVGLFGHVLGGTLEYFSLINPQIVSNYNPTSTAPSYTGAIAGLLTNATLSGPLAVVSNTSTVQSTLGGANTTSYLGGLFGATAGTLTTTSAFTATNDATITAISATTISTGTTIATGYLGGIVGFLNNANFTATNTLINTGNVSLNATGSTPNIYAGGIGGSLTGIFPASMSNTGSVLLNFNTTNYAGVGAPDPVANAAGIAASLGSTASITGALSNQSTIAITGTNSSTLKIGTSYAAGLFSNIASPATAYTFGASGVTWSNTGNIQNTLSNTTQFTAGMIANLTAASALAMPMHLSNTGIISATNGNAGGLMGTVIGSGAGSTNPNTPVVTFTGNLSSSASVTTSSTTSGNVGGLFAQATSAGFTGNITLPTTANTLVNGYNAGGVFQSLTTSQFAPTNAGGLTNVASIGSLNGTRSAAGIATSVTGSIINVLSTISNTGIVYGNVYTGGLFGQVNAFDASTPSTITSPILSNTGLIGINNTIANGFSNAAVAGVIASMDSSSVIASTRIENTSPNPANPLTMLLTGRGTSATNYIAGVFGSVTSSVAPSSIQSPSIVNAQNITLSSSSSSLIQGGVIGYIDGLNGFSFSSGATLENRGFLSTTAGLGVTGGVIGSINNITSSASLNNVIFSQNCNSTGNCVSRTNGIVSTTAGAAFIGVVNNANLSLTTFTFPTNARTSFTYGEGNSGGLIGLFGGANARLPTSALPDTIFVTLVTSNNLYSYVGGLIGYVMGGTIDNAISLSYRGNISITPAAGEGPATSTTTGGIIGRLSNQDGTLNFNPLSMSVTPSTARTIAGGLGGSRGSIYNYIGGIIGFLDGTFNTALSPLNITAPMATANLTLTGGSSSNITVVGGLIGRMTGYATLSGSNIMTNASNLGGSFVGGIVGALSTLNTNPLTNSSFSTSALASLSSSALAAGSVVGVIHNMTYDNTNIARPLNNVTVPTGASGGFGGFAGEITGSTISADIANPSNYTVLGAGTSSFIGGLLGSVDGGSIIQGSLTNIARVSGGNYVGGLVGRLGGPNLFGSNSSAITGGTILGAMSYGDGLPSTGLNSITGTASGTGFGGLIGGMYGASGSQSTLSGPMTLNIGVFDALNPTFAFNAAFTPTAVGGVIGYVNGNVNITSSMSFNPSFSGSPATIYAPTANAVGGWIGQASSAIFAGTTDISSSNVRTIGLNRIGGTIGLIADATVINPGAKFTATSTSAVQIVPSSTVGVYAGGVVGQIGGVGVTASGNATIGGEFTNAGTVSFFTAPSSGTYYIAGVAGNIANFTTITGTDFVNTTKFINTANLTAAANVGSTVYLGGVISLYADAAASGTGIVITNSGNILGTNIVGGNIALLQGGSLFNGSLSGTVSNSGLVQSSLTTGTNYIGGNIGIIGGASFAPNIINTTMTNSGTVSLANTPISGTHYLAGVIGYFNQGTLNTGSTFTNLQNMSATSSFVNLSGVVGLFANGIFASGAFMFNGTSVGNGPTISNTGTSNAPVSGVIGTVLSGTVGGSMTNYGVITGAGTGAAGTTGTAGVIAVMTGGTLNGQGSASLINQANITGGRYVGGLIGYYGGTAALSGSNTLTSNATLVQGTSDVGGVFGRVDVATPTSFNPTGGTLTNNAQVLSSSGTDLGGIFGTFSSTSATAITIAANITNNGQIGQTGTGANNTGGISGTMSGLSSSAKITFAGTLTNTGAVNGASNTGGLFGSTTNLNITGALVLAGNSTITGGATGSGIGGLIGFMSDATTLAPSSITLTGQTVTGLNDVGGFVGKMQGSAGNLSAFSPTGNIVISNATITGLGTNVGSLVGFMSDYSQFAPAGTVGTHLNFSTNTGVSVLGADNVGGLFGNIAVTVANSAIFNPTYTDFSNAASVKVSSPAGTHLGGIFGNFALTGATVDSGNTNIFTNTGVVGDSTLITNASIGTGGIFGNIAGLTGPGRINFGGTLINSGNIYGVSNVGGVVGNASFATFTGNLTGKSNVTGAGNVGGLAGNFVSSTMSGLQMFGDNTASTYTLSLASSGSGLGAIAGNISGSLASGNHLNLSNITVYGNTVFDVANTSNVGIVAGILGNGIQLTGTFLANTGTNMFTISDATNVGAIAGQIANVSNFTSTITNATHLTATNSDNVGGVAGFVLDSTLASGTLSNQGDISGRNQVAGILGDADPTIIANNYVLLGGASVSGNTNVGGLFNLTTGGDTIANSATLLTQANSSVSGNENVGGLIGFLASGTIYQAVTNTYTNNATVSTTADISSIGGIFGRIGAGLTISNALTNAGTVLSQAATFTNSAIGGITGDLNDVTFTNVLTHSGSVIGVHNIGGLFGQMLSTSAVSNLAGATLIATGTVADYDSGSGSIIHTNLGGMIGFLDNASTLPVSITSAAIVNGSVSATSRSVNVGGVIGQSSVALSNTLSGTGSTTGYEYVGGVVGLSTGNITGTLSGSGTVTGTQYAGGVIGAVTAGTLSGTLGFSNGTLTALTSDLGGIIGHMTGGNLQLGLLSVSSNTVFNTPLNIGGAIGRYEGGTLSGTFATNPLTISVAATHVGAMIGLMNAITNFASTVTNQTSLTASTSNAVGGFAGFIQDSSFTSLSSITNRGSIVGQQYVGGVSGVVDPTSLNGSFVSGPNVGNISVTGTADVGGVFGFITGASTLSTDTILSTLSGLTVIGTQNVGGLVGRMDGDTIYNVSAATVFVNNAEVTSTAAIDSIGGLFGFAGSGLTITNTLTNAGYVHNTNALAIGGIMGSSIGVTFANTLSNTGRVEGATRVGGLFGKIVSGQINVGAVNSGLISGTQYVGGLFGELAGGTLAGLFTQNGSVVNILNASIGDLGGIVGLMNGGTLNLATLNIGSNTTFVAPQYIGGAIGAYQSGIVEGVFATNSLNILTGNHVGAVIGAVKNITTFDSSFTNATNLTAGGDGAGGAVGIVQGSTSVPINITGILENTANITGNNKVGAVIGTLEHATLSTGQLINNVSNTLTLGANYLGGLIGQVRGHSTVALETLSIASNVNFAVSGKNYIGGGIGLVENASGVTPTITGTFGNSALTLTISNATYVGTVIGQVLDASQFVTNIINETNLTAATSNQVGGVVGNVNNSIISSTDTGPNNISSLRNNATVQGNQIVGGNIGSLTNNSRVSQASLGGTVRGNTSVGGIVGSIDATSTLQTSYNNSTNTVIGNVGALNVGGIAGINAGTIQDVIFEGVIQALTGSAQIGGIVGFNQTGGSVLSSLSAGSFNLVGSTSAVGAIAGNNGGTLGLAGSSRAPFYSIDTFGTTYGAVGTGSGANFSVQSNAQALSLASTFGSPYNWNFSSTWTQLSGYYVPLQWCTTNCTIVGLPPPPPPPPVPPTNDIPRQYVTVEQILNNGDLTNMEQDYLWFGDTFIIYDVPMPGMDRHYKAAIFTQDPTPPREAAFRANKVLANKEEPPATPKLVLYRYARLHPYGVHGKP